MSNSVTNSSKKRKATGNNLQSTSSGVASSSSTSTSSTSTASTSTASEGIKQQMIAMQKQMQQLQEQLTVLDTSKKQKTASTSLAKEAKPKKIVYQLGETSKYMVEVRIWQGKKQVDVRGYYKNAKNQWKPSKQGVSLSPDEFANLVRRSSKIQEDVAGLHL